MNEVAPSRDPDCFHRQMAGHARIERAAAQEHFLDLCVLPDQSTSNSDPSGTAYASGKGAIEVRDGESTANTSLVAHEGFLDERCTISVGAFPDRNKTAQLKLGLRITVEVQVLKCR